MLRQEREDCGLGVNDKTLRGNRGQHGGLFLIAEKSAGTGTNGCQDNFQSTVGGLSKISLTRKHGTQFGQDLGGEQRRPASNKRVGQFLERRELPEQLSVTA